MSVSGGEDMAHISVGAGAAPPPLGGHPRDVFSWKQLTAAGVAIVAVGAVPYSACTHGGSETPDTREKSEGSSVRTPVAHPSVDRDSPDLLPGLIAKLAASDAVAAAVWRQQYVLGTRPRPVETAPAEQKEAYRAFLAERAKLIVEFQRVRAGVADLVLKGRESSRTRLLDTTSKIYFDAERRKAPGGAADTLVVHETYGHERTLMFGDGDDSLPRWIGQVIDRRFDGPGTSERHDLHLYAARTPEIGSVLRRSEARTLFEGQAIAIAEYRVSPEWLKQASGPVRLSSATKSENPFGSGVFYDFSTEFQRGAEKAAFEIYVATLVSETERPPRVVSEIINLDDPSVPAVVEQRDCRPPTDVRWMTTNESTGRLVDQAGSRLAWDCSFTLSDMDRARSRLVVVHVDLPYSECTGTAEPHSALPAAASKRMIIGQR